MATSFHTINENKIIKILNATKRGRGADGYKFLHLKDVMSGGGAIEDVQNNQTNLVDYFANYFAIR